MASAKDIKMLTSSILLITSLFNLQVKSESHLQLVDGSHIVGKLITKEIKFKTALGELSVPGHLLNNLVVAPTLNPQETIIVNRALANIDSQDYKLRRQAEVDLSRFGKRAYWICKDGLNKEGLSLEAVARLKKVVEEIERKDSKFIRRSDELHTMEVIAFGKVLNEFVEFESDAVGTIKYPIEKITNLKVQMEMEVILDGSNDEDNPLEIKLPGGCDKFSISASGQMDLWPNEAGKYMSGPSGNASGFSSAGGRSGRLDGKINGHHVILNESYEYKGLAARHILVWVNRSPWGRETPQGQYRLIFNFK